MTLTYDENQARIRNRQDERAAAHRPQLEMLAQAAVQAHLLTGDPNWDKFLSYLQAAAEATEGQRDAFAAIIADPATVNHESIMAAKIGLAECTGRLDAWNAVIALPKELREMGAEAKTLLERLPE